MTNANAIATTIKVVINGCYGGFGLSEEATKWLAERGDTQAGVHLADEDNYWGDGEFDQFRFRGQRHDVLLVECVETLGSRRASGTYAELRVVTICSDKYSIRTYDGAESVVTPATVPWVQV